MPLRLRSDAWSWAIHCLAVAGGAAELVELGREAVADDAAVLRLGGRLVGEGAREEVDEVGEFVDVLGD